MSCLFPTAWLHRCPDSRQQAMRQVVTTQYGDSRDRGGGGGSPGCRSLPCQPRIVADRYSLDGQEHQSSKGRISGPRSRSPDLWLTDPESRPKPVEDPCLPFWGAAESNYFHPPVPGFAADHRLDRNNSPNWRLQENLGLSRRCTPDIAEDGIKYRQQLPFFTRCLGIEADIRPNRWQYRSLSTRVSALRRRIFTDVLITETWMSAAAQRDNSYHWWTFSIPRALVAMVLTCIPTSQPLSSQGHMGLVMTVQREVQRPAPKALRVRRPSERLANCRSQKRLQRPHSSNLGYCCRFRENQRDIKEALLGVSGNPIGTRAHGTRQSKLG